MRSRRRRCGDGKVAAVVAVEVVSVENALSEQGDGGGGVSM